MPIYATSTYTQEAPGQHKGYEYSRSGNPTRTAAGDLPGRAGRRRARPGLRLGPGGDDGGAVACSSPATKWRPRPTSTAAPSACSNGSSSPGASSPATPTTPAPPASRALITPGTKLVWIETPTNPLLQILDIAAIAELAHRHGALLAVDNTFASPYLQQPLELGADLVVHSTTKYLGGHSDVVGGAVIGRRRAARADRLLPERRRRRARAVRRLADAARLKTLAVRMERHCANARQLAAWLAEQPQVERVYYPGLPTTPATTWPASQMRDFGGMISLRLKGAPRRRCSFLTRTKLFSLAESLGGVESLIGHPATMTHASIPAEIRTARGIDDGLVRLSVGIEDVDDLQDDLQRGHRRNSRPERVGRAGLPESRPSCHNQRTGPARWNSPRADEAESSSVGVRTADDTARRQAAPRPGSAQRAAPDRPAAVDEIEVRGHIVDSLLLPKILDRILQMGGTFEIHECKIGVRRIGPELRPNRHPGGAPRRSTRSSATWSSTAPRPSIPRTPARCRPTSPGPFPRAFYSTTNQRTQVRLGGRWIDVQDQEMDCGIVLDPAGGDGPMRADDPT